MAIKSRPAQVASTAGTASFMIDRAPTRSSSRTVVFALEQNCHWAVAQHKTGGSRSVAPKGCFPSSKELRCEYTRDTTTHNQPPAFSNCQYKMSNIVTQHIPDFARTAQSFPSPGAPQPAHATVSAHPLGSLAVAPSLAPPPASFAYQPGVSFTTAPALHPSPPFVHEKSHSFGFGSTETASGELLIQARPTIARRLGRACPNPRDWSKKKKIIVSVVIFLILGGIIGGAVGATEAKKTHVCTCPSWTDSFGQGHPGSQYICDSNGNNIRHGPLDYCPSSTV
ncbi:hypothetical protein EHS25_006086 [Saitozyma podzolica]|uniref:Uncharacterized protein n=1 Tax=Saitozyma podzolica TaxID=1890683 RepID=A0A427XTK4_9TREE|nr:hypothetical protein EHS25_006086 [Saitozyma podzolica]